jgi:hypothetical protein
MSFGQFFYAFFMTFLKLLEINRRESGVVNFARVGENQTLLEGLVKDGIGVAMTGFGPISREGAQGQKEYLLL